MPAWCTFRTLQRQFLQRQVSHHPAQAPVLLLQDLQPLHLVQLQAATLGSRPAACRLRHPNRPHTFGHRLALSHQNLNLTQLGDDLLRLLMPARHPSRFRVATETLPPAEHFQGGRSLWVKTKFSGFSDHIIKDRRPQTIESGPKPKRTSSITGREPGPPGRIMQREPESHKHGRAPSVRGGGRCPCPRPHAGIGTPELRPYRLNPDQGWVNTPTSPTHATMPQPANLRQKSVFIALPTHFRCAPPHITRIPNLTPNRTDVARSRHRSGNGKQGMHSMGSRPDGKIGRPEAERVEAGCAPARRVTPRRHAGAGAGGVAARHAGGLSLHDAHCA